MLSVKLMKVVKITNEKKRKETTTTTQHNNKCGEKNKQMILLQPLKMFDNIIGPETMDWTKLIIGRRTLRELFTPILQKFNFIKNLKEKKKKNKKNEAN